MSISTADAGRLDTSRIAEGADPHADERFSMVKELRDSALLIGLTLSTMGAYLAIGAVVVRIFANR